MTEPRRRKLIEVALPLEAINRESAREKSIRHGHPSTLHLWWARRPLAACRAVLFAQLVDDPSARPDLYPTEAEQAVKRKELFDLIERLVIWENSNNQALLDQAHREILASTDGHPPAVLDPFAGGGSIPLEAQRLGLEIHASDLNPVAVLINKALVEIPPHWAGHPPVSPGAADGRLGDWPRATGLADDVRRYGQRIRDEAERRIGHLYPKATLPGGGTGPVIAWIWARTVTCPNPACGISMPLVRSFWLGKRKGRESFVVPFVGHSRMEFTIGADVREAPAVVATGTVTRSGAFCLACRGAVQLSYIRSEGAQGRMSSQLMTVVAEGSRRRVYLAPTAEHEIAANVRRPIDAPDMELSTHPQYMGTPRYGMTTIADLFTNRQLVALTVLSELISRSLATICDDASAYGLPSADARSYAGAVVTYLAFALSKLADRHSSITNWYVSRESTSSTFARQAIPITWDFAETNPLLEGSGSFDNAVQWTAEVLDGVLASGAAVVSQADAATRSYDGALLVTDPPYYDNVPYADLSDFFYAWLRRCLYDIYPDLLSTIVTPKREELVADQVRLGGKLEARKFFEEGFIRVFSRARDVAQIAVPSTVFYAFKQTESDEAGIASTGWQTLLEGMVRSGWEVTATWPMRTELGNRMRGMDSNALASSIVLAIRPRPLGAETLTRRTFLSTLKGELPDALRHIQEGGVAPVDLAQAAIGPGMAIFSRCAQVVEADGADMTVRTALTLINQALDEVLTEQEGDFDADTRFCIAWFGEHGFDEGAAGEADTLSRAKNTSVGGLEHSGVFRARAGKAWLLSPDDLPPGFEPSSGERTSVWTVVLHLAKALTESGTDVAAGVMASVGSLVDLGTAKELAYLLYSICERRGWAQTALLFNGLGTSWNDLAAASKSAAAQTGGQGALNFEG